jgi:hypothetical protein
MVRTAGGSPATTAYSCDEDNRLTQAIAGSFDFLPLFFSHITA